MVRLSVSTWTFHEALGRARYELDVTGTRLVNKSDLTPALDLLDLPAEIARHGIHTLEICHFHIPSLEDAYLARLRAALEEAGVTLYSLLMDAGDVSNPDLVRRAEDIHLIRRWIEVAAQLGARTVRIDAGLSDPTPETIRLAAAAFTDLADYAVQWGVRPATENWHSMSRQPAHLLQILDLCQRDFRLVVDFGNARGPHKYEWLAQLMPYATSIHAWAEYDAAGHLQQADFRRCLEIARAHDFAGPISLLYNQTPDVWGGLAEMRREVEQVLEVMPAP